MSHLVTIDMLKFSTPAAFGPNFTAEFDLDPSPLPAFPMSYSRSKKWPWSRFVPPATPYTLLLHTDGRVIASRFPTDQMRDEADYVIEGGHAFVGYDDSWQAMVLAAAGFPLKEYLP